MAAYKQLLISDRVCKITIKYLPDPRKTPKEHLASLGRYGALVVFKCWRKIRRSKMATVKQMKARIDRPIYRPRDMASSTVLNFKYSVDAVSFEYAVLKEG